MNVLSLFDGISCGMVALERAGVKVDKYFASEIDKHAINISKSNYPNIIHIGDVSKVFYNNGTLHTEFGKYSVGKIDLLLGGSPCQGFSLAGDQLAFDDERSKLYFEYERILNEIKAYNPSVKFILENVKMKVEYKDAITKRLGVQPILINSNLVSAQNRPRLYWTNIPTCQPEPCGIVLSDILEDSFKDKLKFGKAEWVSSFINIENLEGYINVVDCPETPFILQWPHGSNKGGFRALDGKTPTITTSSWQHNNYLVYKGIVRKLTPVECERLQTLPDNYTKVASDSQRYKALGNGWTVDVIVHILKGMLYES